MEIRWYRGFSRPYDVENPFFISELVLKSAKFIRKE
jgi:hypothetical protein